MAAKTEKPGVPEQVNDFIQKNRKLLLISLAGIIGIIVILVTVFSVRDAMISGAYKKVDEFERRYQAVKQMMNSEYPDSDMINGNLGLLLEDLSQFGRRNSGYAAARAYSIEANINEELQNWKAAETSWTNAAKAASKTYFAPVAFFNAAVAAEEQGNDTGAIDLYNKALDYGNDFPAGPRAQFSIGRIRESMGDSNAAIAAYQTLVGRWPQDQIWVNLAHSRIIHLSGIRNSGQL